MFKGTRNPQYLRPVCRYARASQYGVESVGTITQQPKKSRLAQNPKCLLEGGRFYVRAFWGYARALQYGAVSVGTLTEQPKNARLAQNPECLLEGGRPVVPDPGSPTQHAREPVSDPRFWL
eukprot:scaffold211649_cov34-Tisochrysis_lutea.AAC.6